MKCHNIFYYLHFLEGDQGSSLDKNTQKTKPLLVNFVFKKITQDITSF